MSRPERGAPFLDAVRVPVPVAGVHLFEYAAVPDWPGGLQYFDVLPGAETPLDQHESQEIWSVRAGAGELFYDGAWHALKAGDCVHFPARRPHRMRNTGSQSMSIVALWWKGGHGQS